MCITTKTFLMHCIHTLNITIADQAYFAHMDLFQSSDMISEQFDACASWWTQGPDANLQVSFLFLVSHHKWL